MNRGYSTLKYQRSSKAVKAMSEDEEAAGRTIEAVETTKEVTKPRIEAVL